LFSIGLNLINILWCFFSSVGNLHIDLEYELNARAIKVLETFFYS